MVGKQPYSGGEDRRREPRYRLDDSVVMVDTDSGAELGLVLDLHHHGFMLMCPSGVEQGRSFGLKMLLPRHIDGCSDLILQANCLWTAESMSEGAPMQWAGFAIVAGSVKSLIGLKEVIAEFGVEPKE